MKHGSDNPDALVGPTWLARHIEAVEIRIVYASWSTLSGDRSAKETFAACHLPYAVAYDFARLRAEGHGLVPPPARFAKLARELGVGNGNRIFIYDEDGETGAAAYLWWLFRLFGHEDVAVLDGGLKGWLVAGQRVSSRPRKPNEHNFIPIVQEQMLAHRSGAQSCCVFDDLGRGGPVSVCERSGQNPSLGCRVLLDWQGDIVSMRPARELATVYETASVDLAQSVTLCGTDPAAFGMHGLALFLLGIQSLTFDTSPAADGERGIGPASALTHADSR